MNLMLLKFQKVFIGLVVLILACLISYGQGTGSSGENSATGINGNDSIRIRVLNKKGDDELNEGKFESALKNFQQALSLAQRSNLSAEEIIAYQNIGNVYSDWGNNSEALKHYETARQISQQAGNFKLLAQCYNLMGIVYFNQGEYQKAEKNYLEALGINIKIEDVGGKQKNYNNLGQLQFHKGHYTKALRYFESSLKIAKQNNNRLEVLRSLNNIAISYYKLGNYPEALSYQLASMKMNEEAGNKRELIADYMNLGLIYLQQENFDEALKNQAIALKISRSLGSKRDIAMNLSSMGVINSKMGHNDLALENHREALQINMALENKTEISANYTNIGWCLKQKGLIDEAIGSFESAKKIVKELDDKDRISSCNLNIAEMFILKKKFPEAKKLLNETLPLTLATRNKENIKLNYYYLSRLDSLVGNWKDGFNHKHLYYQYRDSLINEGNIKKLVQAQMNYDFERKQTAQKLIQQNKDAIAAQDKKRQNIITFSIGLGLVIVVVFSFLLMKRINITLKQKRIIEIQKKLVEQQKSLVEEKNKQVTDSINYAKRIQNAILPPAKFVQEHLPNSFIFYLPKDIVAGDFYWMEVVGDWVLFAVCDCTGHGVPGAMVSVVCHNALNRSVREFGLTEPAKILNKTLEIVKESFEKSEDEIKDGMDLGLCGLNKKTLSLQFAGANNPVLIFRNNELTEIKADKQAIGVSEYNKPFTGHHFQLNKNDVVYLSSDGYADQFGGESGRKKLTKKKFKEMLLQASALPIKEQEQYIRNFYFGYKKDTEQIDDILVLGLVV